MKIQSDGNTHVTLIPYVFKINGFWFGMLITSVVFGVTAPQWARASSFTRFLDHTQRRATVGRNPLDEWTARRRDLYLTTHNTHNRKTTMSPVGFEPTISEGERPKTYALDHAVTGIGLVISGGINLVFGFRLGWRPPRPLGVFHEIKKKKSTSFGDNIRAPAAPLSPSVRENFHKFRYRSYPQEVFKLAWISRISDAETVGLYSRCTNVSYLPFLRFVSDLGQTRCSDCTRDVTAQH
jgi:hypothetical protein